MYSWQQYLQEHLGVKHQRCVMQEAAGRAEADVEPEALQAAVATAEWVGGDDGGGFATPRPMTGIDSAGAEDAEEQSPRETTYCSGWLSIEADEMQQRVNIYAFSCPFNEQRIFCGLEGNWEYRMWECKHLC